MSKQRDPFETFQRQARRAIRNHVRDLGQVPALAAVVSIGEEPKRVRVAMNLHLHEDALAVKARIQAEVRHWRARYAAVVQMRELPEHGHFLLVTAVTVDENEQERVAKWYAPVTTVETPEGTAALSVGGWDRGNFRPGDYSFLVRTIQETLGATP